MFESEVFEERRTGKGADRRVEMIRPHGEEIADPMEDQKPPVLDNSSIEAIARRVCELLAEAEVVPPRPLLVTAAELATRLGRKRTWVYENADGLGALRLGDGSRPRLMFNLAEVEDRLRSSPRDKAPPELRRRAAPRRSWQAKTARKVELLPVGPTPRRPHPGQDGT
jgi:hypothetical protein